MVKANGATALDACPACGRETSPGQAFCVACGTRLPQSPTPAGHNPFERIKIRSLVIWAAATFAITMALFTVIAVIFDLDTDDPANLTFVFDIWLYGALAAWLAWQFWRRRVRMAKLIGSLSKGYDWLPTVGILVTTVLFSLGSLVLVLALVSFVSADRVESFIGRDPLAETTTSAAPLVFLFALAVSLLIAAPITEELLFRGVMLHRFAVKWGLGPAIVVSSVLFGLLHQFNFVGAATFGLVMSLLYVRTRTLIVPIACHVLSNAVVVFLVVVRELTGGTGEEESSFTADQVRGEVVVGVVLVLLTAPILARFVYKNWPRLGVRPPYFT